ncbi:MAG: Yip1 family protein, partial [Usitatibacteraceae bacterium]
MGLVDRAKNICLTPKTEWPVIAGETATTGGLMSGYVAPLAASPPVAGLSGSLIFEPIRVGSISAAIIGVFVTWVVTIALVFLIGVLINTLADQFDADRNDIGAQKVAAYSITPALLSGLFSLWPPLWWVSLIALAAMVYVM